MEQVFTIAGCHACRGKGEQIGKFVVYDVYDNEVEAEQEQKCTACNGHGVVFLTGMHRNECYVD